MGPLGTIMAVMGDNIVYSLFPVAHWMSAAAVLAAAIRTQSIAQMAGKIILAKCPQLEFHIAMWW